MRAPSAAVVAALALTLFAWGCSYVWTKQVLGAMGPATLVCVRFSLATALFALAFWLTGKRPQPLTRADHARLFGLALLQPAGHFAFETWGLVFTGAGEAALIVAAIPLAVTALAVLSGRERPSLRVGARLVLSVLGVGLIMGQPHLSATTGGRAWLGDLLMLGAVFSTAGYVVLGGALTRRLDALTVTFSQLAWGAVLFFPGCLWELAARGLPALTGRETAALAALTVLASFAAFACYNYVLGRMSATRAALWLNAVPLVTAVAAWWLLGERLGAWQAAGGAMVLAAAVLPGRQTAAAEPKAIFPAAVSPRRP